MLHMNTLYFNNGKQLVFNSLPFPTEPPVTWDCWWHSSTLLPSHRTSCEQEEETNVYFMAGCFILSHFWCSPAYSSETSALSSALSSSPSRTTSLRVTCRKTKSYIKAGQNQKCWISMDPEGQWLTSSHLRSASSAMFFASLSCNSWISIFSSSFIALFSITFMPLRSSETSTIQQGQQGI